MSVIYFSFPLSLCCFLCFRHSCSQWLPSTACKVPYHSSLVIWPDVFSGCCARLEVGSLSSLKSVGDFPWASVLTGLHLLSHMFSKMYCSYYLLGSQNTSGEDNSQFLFSSQKDGHNKAHLLQSQHKETLDCFSKALILGIQTVKYIFLNSCLGQIGFSWYPYISQDTAPYTYLDCVDAFCFFFFKKPLSWSFLTFVYNSLDHCKIVWRRSMFLTGHILQKSGNS